MSFNWYWTGLFGNCTLLYISDDIIMNEGNLVKQNDSKRIINLLW